MIFTDDVGACMNNSILAYMCSEFGFDLIKFECDSTADLFYFT
jgi:hypothetical protein